VIDDAIVVVMAEITLNEGLAWLKTLKKRHEELIALRDNNAHRERRFLGSMADKDCGRRIQAGRRGVGRNRVTRVYGEALKERAVTWAPPTTSLDTSSRLENGPLVV